MGSGSDNSQMRLGSGVAVAVVWAGSCLGTSMCHGAALKRKKKEKAGGHLSPDTAGIFARDLGRRNLFFFFPWGRTQEDQGTLPGGLAAWEEPPTLLPSTREMLFCLFPQC